MQVVTAPVTTAGNRSKHAEDKPSGCDCLLFFLNRAQRSDTDEQQLLETCFLSVRWKALCAPPHASPTLEVTVPPQRPLLCRAAPLLSGRWRGRPPTLTGPVSHSPAPVQPLASPSSAPFSCTPPGPHRPGDGGQLSIWSAPLL